MLHRVLLFHAAVFCHNVSRRPVCHSIVPKTAARIPHRHAYSVPCVGTFPGRMTSHDATAHGRTSLVALGLDPAKLLISCFTEAQERTRDWTRRFVDVAQVRNLVQDRDFKIQLVCMGFGISRRVCPHQITSICLNKIQTFKYVSSASEFQQARGIRGVMDDDALRRKVEYNMAIRQKVVRQLTARVHDV